MIRYSDQALSARPTFFGPYNDITIIVEDTNKEPFYTEVFRRLLGSELTITRVLGVGGKSTVLTRLADRSGDPLGRPEFYVVDGDFDELINRQSSGSTNFYKLRRYDIESYLMEETAICTVAQEQSPSVSLAVFKSSLQIDNWVSEIVGASIRLAACAALLQELDDRRTRISQSIERYIGLNPILPDESAIQSCIDRVAYEQGCVEPAQFYDLLESMTKRMGTSQSEHVRWISGKHILIPLVIRLLKSKGSANLSKDSLCFRLAKHCDFGGLVELRDRILAVAQSALRPEHSHS